MEFAYVVWSIILFFIAVFITRWMFKINILVKNLEKQTKLLTEVAKKMNVDETAIKKILTEE